MELLMLDPEIAMMLAIAGGALVVYELLLVMPLRLRVRQLHKDADLFERALQSVRDFATRVSEDRKRSTARLMRLEERIAQLHLRTDARPYEQAIALAEHGAEQKSLSSTLGLTQGEAELVSLLHGSRPRAQRQERR